MFGPIIDENRFLIRFVGKCLSDIHAAPIMHLGNLIQFEGLHVIRLTPTAAVPRYMYGRPYPRNLIEI